MNADTMLRDVNADFISESEARQMAERAAPAVERARKLRDAAKHTPGKIWISYVGNTLHSEPLYPAAHDGKLYSREVARTCLTELGKADAKRLEECWNACDGINPEAVPVILEALTAIAAMRDAIAGEGHLPMPYECFDDWAADKASAALMAALTT